MLTIGFSTGALALGDFVRGLRLLETKHVDAVELSALRAVELPEMLAILPLHLERLKARYRYISFHAPTDYKDEYDLVEQLTNIAKLGLNIVIHPDTIRDISLWRTLGSYVCLENMDSRKKTGRTAKELYKFFNDLSQAKLCFDVAHARQVDPTMTEAACVLSEFGDRLAQVHLSEVDGRGKHFAMSYGAKLAYEQFSEVLSEVPVILESIVREEDIDSEITKARVILTHHLRYDLRNDAKKNILYPERPHIAGE
jgi:hypothetical protein